jgi:FtsH-binding integral membrane protein
MTDVPSRRLFTIRIAIAAGVAAFAALSAYERAREPVGPEQAAMVPLETMRLALWGLAAACVLGALFLRSRMDDATPQRRRIMTIIGWALGEGVALFGIVQHHIGGAPSTMALGILAFVVTLLLLPVPRESRLPG